MKMLAPIGVNELTGFTGAVYTPNAIRVVDVAPEDIVGALGAGFVPVGVQTTQDGIVALAGGGADGAPVLLAQVCRVTVVASNNDSVVLRPDPEIGDLCVVINATGDNVVNVFYGSQQQVAAVHFGLFCCISNGTWTYAGPS